MRVVLDTNFLLIPGQFGVDIFAEMNRVLHAPHTVVVPDSVLNELKMMATGKTKDARAAKLALGLIEKKGVHVLPHHEKKADDAIREMAVENYTVGATQDKELQRYVRERNVALVSRRGKILRAEGLR